MIVCRNPSLDDNDDYIITQDGETISMSEAIEREHEQFAAYVNENGVSGSAGFLEARLQEWNKYIVRIVFIGSSG
jgi:hypothetical protein